MSLDPNRPYDVALILAAELRDQFVAAMAEINALKARVAALERATAATGSASTGGQPYLNSRSEDAQISVK